MRVLRRLVPFVGVAVAAAGCEAAAPGPEFEETPTIALLLTPTPPPRQGFPPDSGLFAALVTTGTPVRSPFLRAERFEMRRLSDGAHFAWRWADPGDDAVPVFPRVGIGNYFLSRHAGAGGLGSDSLAPGEAYELVVEAGGHRIVGRTRIPGAIEFVREATDGDSVVRWRRAPGAARYTIGEEPYVFPATRFIADTAAVVQVPAPFPGEPPRPFVVTVFALDSNHVAFGRDPRVSRAGITGAWGVFGSYTWAGVELPRPAGSRAPP